MVTQSKIESLNQEEIVNDIDETPQVDLEKLAALKARAAQKRAQETQEKTQEEVDVPPRIVEERQRSLRFGIIGSGQGGSRISEQFFSLGYPTVVINTATQDLENIKIPENQKLLLDFGLGGCARDVTLGYEAADSYRAAINQLIQRHLGDAEMFIFCTSLGGGSGAGSVPVVIDILAKIGKPVAVLTVLPKASEDAQLKHNAWQTLSKFTKLFAEGKVHNIIIVDNAKIESLYSDVGPFNFFNVSNKAIVEPLNVFNTLSRRPDEGVKALDSSEFGKLFMDGRGFTTYGVTEVPDYEDEMSIATAIVESLKGNLLASGFDIRQARYAGFMLVAPERIWNKIPSSSIHYAQSMILDACDGAGIFHGIYKEESDDDCIKVYSMFSGLGLPEERINQLKTEAQLKIGVAQRKDDIRNLTMKVDVGEETVNQVEEIKKKIQQKSSSFAKLHNAAVQDRRKK